MNNKIKNLLVTLDLSDMDEVLIDYASFIADRLKAEKVYFVHNIKKYEISELFQEDFKNVNLDDVIGDELNEKVQQRFTASAEWDVLISEDPYSESLIKYVADKYEIQLALVGNKNKIKGTGVVSSKLLRLLRCDILSVPPNARHELEKVWAGVDFSQESKKVFRVIRELQEQEPVEAKAVHMYSVPVQFSAYASMESMAPRIEKHARERSEKFLKKMNSVNVEPLIIRARESGVAEKFREETAKSKVDLLIVADKGSNTFSTLLIGSVSEDLFKGKLEVPLWIAKKY